jgi:hypothetical protein
MKKFSHYSRKFKNFLQSKRLWNWVIRLVAAGLVLIAFLFIWFSKDLPDPNKLVSLNLQKS